MTLGIGAGAVLVAASIVTPPAGDNTLNVDLSAGEEAGSASETSFPQLLVAPDHGAAKVRAVHARGGHFLVAPGESGRSGPGRLQTFRVEIESGIKGITPSQFAAEVEDRLLDHRGWGHKDGRSLQRISTGKSDFRVTLTKAQTVDQMCYPLATHGFVSCYAYGRAIINLNRWRKGAPDFSSLQKYRTYLINHEVGHALGKGHWFCPHRGGPGRVMMQQTYAMSDKCAPQRFPRPDAPKFKSKCSLSVQTRAGQLRVRGRVAITPTEQRVTLTASGDGGSTVLGAVDTTVDGRFSVPINPGSLGPSTRSIFIHFAGTDHLIACKQSALLIPAT